MTHEQLISKVCIWFWNTYPEQRRMLYSINNNISEGLLSYIRPSQRAQAAKLEGAKNKAKGVIAGVLDLCYITPYGFSVYLDAKVGVDKLSEEQIDFCEKLSSRRIEWRVFSTEKEFKEIIMMLQWPS